MNEIAAIIANGLILLANLGILALSLKLYTEYFKDRSMERRKREMTKEETDAEADPR